MSTSAAPLAPEPLEHRFQLDLTLDVPQLRDDFLRNRRLLVPRILRTADARALYDALSQEPDWGLVFGGGAGERFTIPAEECGSLGVTRQREILDAAYRHGGTNNAHLFCTRGIAKLKHSGLLLQFAQFMNSAQFLGFIRGITEVATIRKIITTVSCYRPGHFYAFHLDVAYDHEGEQLGSIVFNVTPEWKPQWGGLLQFKSPDFGIAETFFPRFNSLSFFTGDQHHAVSCVAPFAASNRYTINGKLIA